jgi:hypothetical protein
MPAMNKPLVEIQITSERVSIRGQLSEFEASGLLQDALSHQTKLKTLQRESLCLAFFNKYQALIFYPILAAFAIGLSLSFLNFSTHSSHTAEHYESY